MHPGHNRGDVITECQGGERFTCQACSIAFMLILGWPSYHTATLPEYHASKHQSTICAKGALSSYRFFIYDKILWNRICCCSPADWKPFDRVFVVEGPRGDDREEGECGATKSDVDSELDVLQEVSDEEGNSAHNAQEYGRQCLDEPLALEVDLSLGDIADLVEDLFCHGRNTRAGVVSLGLVHCIEPGIGCVQGFVDDVRLKRPLNRWSRQATLELEEGPLLDT